jgi:hypothetical protein
MTTSEYTLLFTEDLRDCLLCPVRYSAHNDCVDFRWRKPYPIVQTLSAESWEAAKVKAAIILAAFAADTDGDSETLRT